MEKVIFVVMNYVPLLIDMAVELETTGLIKTSIAILRTLFGLRAWQLLQLHTNRT